MQNEILLSALSKGQYIRFVAVRDEKMMHARYLLSLRGAIKFDKGFDAPLDNLIMDVEAVGRALHLQLVQLYIDGEPGFDIDDEAGYELRNNVT